MGDLVRAAAVQLTSTADRERNLATADRLTREAASAGAELVVLPERWPVLDTPEQPAAGAEPIDGPALTWASETARELGIDLVAGSIAERVEGADRGANTSVHFGPDGEDRATYRKIHMFDVEVGGRAYRESPHEAPGDEPVTSALANGEGLGLTICYDLRFPELFRILAIRGATVVTVPAAFTETTTRDHWEVLLRARAIEDQCFVVAAIDEIDAQPIGPRDKLYAIASFIVDSYRHDRDLMKVIIVEVTRAANTFGATHLAEIRKAYTRIADIVERAQADGTFRAGITPEFAALAFYGAVEQVLTGWIFGLLAEGEGDYERAKHFIVDTICDG